MSQVVQESATTQLSVSDPKKENLRKENGHQTTQKSANAWLGQERKLFKGSLDKVGPHVAVKE